MGLGTIAETRADAKPGSPQSFATRTVLAVGGVVAVVLVAVSGRYGYHRDELYFLAAGHHLAWGYPDQPPFVAVLARGLSALAPGSVTVLRVPSALAAGAVVVLAGLTARELGADRGGQTLASVVLATGGVVLGTGHLLSTATFDLLAWAVLIWLVVRMLRTRQPRYWVLIGMVAGVGLLDSDLVAFLMAALVAGLALAGPRELLRSPWLWVGGALAALLWSPYLVWQAAHSWPELTVSRSIAAGNSGTSQPRALLVPEQLVLLSPYLAPVWIAGLVRLLRSRILRRYRSVAVAYLLLAVVFTVTGGKSYYLAGAFPVLVAAGAQPAWDWVHREPARRTALGIGVGVTGLSAALITLPVLPVSVLHHTPLVKFNYDTGETIGWSSYVAEVATVYRRLPAAEQNSTAIVALNYGEAGAVDRFGGAMGLPRAYGVHNGYWYWGPPPATETQVVAVGFSSEVIDRLCPVPVLAGRLHNPWEVKDDEQGAPVWYCSRIRGTWKELWPRLKVIG